MSLIDGIIITGGNFDINPTFYAETIDGSRIIKEKRTNFEIEIFNKFLETSKPILGICGGEQLMNVASGGDLIQDINASINTNIKHEQPNPRNEVSHEVNIKRNSRLFQKNLSQIYFLKDQSFLKQIQLLEIGYNRHVVNLKELRREL